MKKILVIGYVWIESNSSAAGSRMLQLLDLFKKQGYEIHFVSTAAPTDYSNKLADKGIHTKRITLNCDSFDVYIKHLNPDIVLYDRFMMEEQFGWRVRSVVPNALQILDTEDLHCLRKTRHAAFKKNVPFTVADLKASDITKREIASIYRCDLSLMISTFEMELLKDSFGVDSRLLYYLPLLIQDSSNLCVNTVNSFDKRQHFTTIGNFLHAPNYDMVLYLKNTVWKLIRKRLPKAEIHIYGAYTSQKVLQLHNEKEGFFVKGRAAEVATVMTDYKVLLAPLRFGAGIKGKFIDAMQYGLPSVTTEIGAEGMTKGREWPGVYSDDIEAIVDAAVNLYTNQREWENSQLKGFKLLNEVYDSDIYESQFASLLEMLIEHMSKHRDMNFVGQMLQHHTLQSTKFMSKWIAEKNKSLTDKN